jgi:hypothetical protein
MKYLRKHFLHENIDVNKFKSYINDYINNETSGLPDYIPGKIYYKEVQKDGRIFNKNHKDSLYLNDFIDQINKSNNKIYSLSIRLFEYVEYDKNWYKKYE